MVYQKRFGLDWALVELVLEMDGPGDSGFC